MRQFYQIPQRLHRLLGTPRGTAQSRIAIAGVGGIGGAREGHLYKLISVEGVECCSRFGVVCAFSSG